MVQDNVSQLHQWALQMEIEETSQSKGQVMPDQQVRYNGRRFHGVLVTHIEKDTQNRGIDRQYGDHLTYGRVTLPVDQNKFIAIQRDGYWLVVDTI